MGEVFSHPEFRTFGNMLGFFVFHTICMVLGMACLVRSLAPRPAVDEVAAGR